MKFAIFFLSANSGAVLSTLKCFLHLTDKFPDLHPQLYSRAKPPLLTLVTGGHSEIQFSVLKHLEILLPRPTAQGIFDDEFRQFFVRYNEPPHIKHLKVKLIPFVSNDSNAKEIAAELSEYVTDVDAELSSRAIHAIGAIAMRVTTVSSDMTMRLVDLVDLDISHVRSESIKNLANIVRIFPAMKAVVVPSLARCLRRVDHQEAKSSVIWMIGEYAEDIMEAPYMIEKIIDSYDNDLSSSMKTQLLIATMKMFFKRPAEVQGMLGRILRFAINDQSDQDVHDRALLYYRLLTADINVASSLFQNSAHIPPASSTGYAYGIFSEDTTDDLSNQVFAEFNTLAVIYGVPSVRFIDEPFQKV